MSRFHQSADTSAVRALDAGAHVHVQSSHRFQHTRRLDDGLDEYEHLRQIVRVLVGSNVRETNENRGSEIVTMTASHQLDILQSSIYDHDIAMVQYQQTPSIQPTRNCEFEHETLSPRSSTEQLDIFVNQFNHIQDSGTPLQPRQPVGVLTNSQEH